MSRGEKMELEMAELLGGSQITLDPTGGSVVAAAPHNVYTNIASRCVMVYGYTVIRTFYILYINTIKLCYTGIDERCTTCLVS